MYVYLLESLSAPGERYVGLTADLHRRLDEHNAGKSPHTSRHRPWRVIVAVWFADEAKARAFEAYLKSGSGHAFAKRHFWRTHGLPPMSSRWRMDQVG
jgi:putative endonuclease